MAKRKSSEIIEYATDRPNDTPGPCVIGLPGFVGTLKNGRIEDILQNLSNKDYTTYGLIYSGIERQELGKDKSLVICDFDLNQYVKDFKAILQTAQENPAVDNDRIGVLASSISGAVFSSYLAQEGSSNIKTYISISPLVGWEYYGNEAQREFLLQARERQKQEIKEGKDISMPFFPITTPYDKTRGIERVIPLERVDRLKKVDGIRELEGVRLNGMRVQTHFGKMDNVSSPKSIMGFHQALGGEFLDCIPYEGEEHAIPIGEMRNLVLSFFDRFL